MVYFYAREREHIVAQLIHAASRQQGKICRFLQLLKGNGGDDGTRTRGLCRDRESGRCNLSKSNGVGGRRLVLEGTVRHFLSSPYRPRIWSTARARCCSPSMYRNDPLEISQASKIAFGYRN